MDPIAPVCHIGCPRRLGTVCDAWLKSAPNGQWENHGPSDAPVLTPSYDCKSGCGWHGFIVDGKLIDRPLEGISALHVCVNCQHPEIVIVSIQPAPMPNGQVGVAVGIIRKIVRQCKVIVGL